MLTSAVAFSLRRDGGGAETGARMELGGSLGYADPACGLSVVVRGRTLVAHGDAVYHE